MKPQVLFLNGAVPKEKFASYYQFLETREYNPYEEKFLNWNKTLGEKLGEDFEYLRSAYDGIDFADYEAWKLMFEKMFPYIRDNFVVVATSLGGTFILKYMLETGFPKNIDKNISKIFFLAPALRPTAQERLGSFGFDISQLGELHNIADQVFIYHSSDDDLVPLSDSLELYKYFPHALFREFTDKGHFYKEAELPELVVDIKA